DMSQAAHSLSEHALLRPQRNALFQAITERGLDPAEFAFEDRPSAYDSRIRVPVLVHRPTGFSFTFDTQTVSLTTGTGYSKRVYDHRTERRSRRTPGV